jgi:exodeoxyribonuclease-5
LGDVHGFLVDEASMVSKPLYDDLLSFDLPMILVGDHGQLPPVGSDINLMADPDHRLETVHRNAGEIAFFAEHLRNGGNPWDFQAKDRVNVIATTEVDDQHLLECEQIIAAFNKSRCGINDRVRSLLGHKGLLQKGERIICLRNNRRCRLFNGMTANVQSVDLAEEVIDFEADGETYKCVPFDPDVFGEEKPEINYDLTAANPFDYAYAITCHKAQGGEWDNVLAYEQYCPYWEHNRWTYTAASRARKRLTWVTGVKKPQRKRKQLEVVAA